MYQFQLEGLRCRRCVVNIENAIKTLDPSSEIQIDMQNQLAKVKTKLTARTIMKTIEELGYSVTNFLELSY